MEPEMKPPYLQDFINRTGRQPEKMHLFKDVVSALERLADEGVRFRLRKDNFIKKDSHFLADYEIEIEVNPTKICSVRTDGIAYKALRVLDKAVGACYPRWIRDRLAYRVSVEPLTFGRAAGMLSNCLGIRPAAMENDSLTYEAHIDGINPIMERVHVRLRG